MCDECDDTRSLDFSMYDFDRSPIPNSHLFPPQYMAWWKPPSSYFPPRCEAPPPYEEAIASTSNFVPAVTTLATNISSNTTILTNENINHPLAINNSSEDLGNPSATETFSPPEVLIGIGTSDSARAPTTEPIPGPSTMVVSNTELNENRTEPSASEITKSSTVLPTYSVVTMAPGRDCFRHSLTLPRRANLQEIREFGLELNGAEQFSRNQQRYSLQLNVMDWGSSTSTISLSPSTPMTPIGIRNPSLSSSSSSCSSNNTH